MNGQNYRKELSTKSLPFITALYRKVFGTPPPSALRKPDIIEKLGSKFDEICEGAPVFVNEECEEEPEKKSKSCKPKKSPQKRVRKTVSRRGRIIAEIKTGIWCGSSLAEALNLENPKWDTNKNKSAIIGTCADLRKQGWKINIDKGKEKGRIIVEKCIKES